MTTLRVLHISDLHATANSKVDQSELVEAMLTDAETFAATGPFDLAVFSGDLAFSGSEEDFALAQRLLLEPLEKRLGLPRDRIVIVPGNHDVTRTAVSPIYEAGLQHTLGDREAVNRLLDDEHECARASARLRTFEDFYATYFQASAPTPVGPLARVRRVDIRGTSVGLVGLNSAWRSCGDGDRERLLLGDRQVKAGLDAVRDCEIRLVAVHHPLAWLAPFDSQTARALFEKRGSLVLSGHEHSTDPSSEVTLRGAAIYSRAGCLYETQKYKNSYSVLDIDTDAGWLEMYMRTWFSPERREFDAAVDLVAAGRIGFPLPGRPKTAIRPVHGVRHLPAERDRRSADPTQSQGVLPAELQEVARRAYTPLYKNSQEYTFEVLEVCPDSLRVNLGVGYTIVNPTPASMEHRPGLTPMRPLRVTSAVIGGEAVDLENPDFHAERGLVVPIVLPPHSETRIDLWGEVGYRLPDSEVFLTYFPAMGYQVELRLPGGDADAIRFVHEALMPDHLRREASTSGAAAHVRYTSVGPVLAYWGMKLDWLPSAGDIISG